MKKTVVIASALFSFMLHAAHVVDVYGVDEKESRQIIQRYEKRVADMQDALYQEIKKGVGDVNPDFEKKIRKIKADLRRDLNQEKGYLYIDFGTVMYPKKEALYTTIEIVKKNQPERLRFVSRENQNKVYPVKHDLIDKMSHYSELEMNLIMNHKVDLSDSSCPVYHCVTGFHHPQLKPYLAVFNEGVTHQKKLIIDTLNHDENPERRVSAAFLVGHFNNPNEIIAILSPHVLDPDEATRNAVMRVMDGTLNKAGIKTFDLTPFLALFDSPSDTDRNKSLLAVLSSDFTPAKKQQIIQTSGETLINLLALKQPNNHLPAYEILKKISGKDFGEFNLSAWRAWLSHAQSRTS
jgi:hypothetical protein